MSIRSLLKKSKDLQAVYDWCKVIIYKKSRWGVISKYLVETAHPKLHLGSGSNILKGWLNTDFAKPNQTIFMDVTEKFPFQDNTFEIIMAEHLIEHISYKDGKFMLEESFRTLKRGGVLRIGTPDIAKYIDLYKKDLTSIEMKTIKQITDWWISTGFFKAKEYVPKKDTYNPVFVINDIFNNYEHRFIYDFQTLKEIVADAGFVNIKRCIAGKSEFHNLTDVETHITEVDINVTLTIEAYKV